MNGLFNYSLRLRSFTGPQKLRKWYNWRRLRSFLAREKKKKIYISDLKSDFSAINQPFFSLSCGCSILSTHMYVKD
jgi:hypothetical protein